MTASTHFDPACLQGTAWQGGWGRAPANARRGDAAGLVIKFGGSLMGWPDWPKRLEDLLGALPGGAVRLVVGGGPVANGLRELDAACPQPAERMHRLAIEGMRITAQLVAECLGLTVLDDPLGCVATCGVIDPLAALKRGLLRNLPADWQITSDSIAAALAAAAHQTLVLAKSVPPPTTPAAIEKDPTLPAWSLAGWVDPFFAKAAATVDGVAWVAPVR
jgi:hypothetical protein